MFIHALKYLMCDKLSLVVCKKKKERTSGLLWRQEASWKIQSSLEILFVIKDQMQSQRNAKKRIHERTEKCMQSIAAMFSYYAQQNVIKKRLLLLFCFSPVILVFSLIKLLAANQTRSNALVFIYSKKPAASPSPIFAPPQVCQWERIGCIFSRRQRAPRLGWLPSVGEFNTNQTSGRDDSAWQIFPFCKVQYGDFQACYPEGMRGAMWRHAYSKTMENTPWHTHTLNSFGLGAQQLYPMENLPYLTALPQIWYIFFYTFS